MKILLVASEIAELAPVGGIAEYVLGLGCALLKKGHDVRVAIPAYLYLSERNDLRVIKGRLVAQLGVGASEVTSVRELAVDCPGEIGLRLPVVILGSHKHFETVRSPQREIYQWPNHEPWIAFSRAVIDWLDTSDWQPEVIHCQDAHTALIPIYIRQMRLRQAHGLAYSTRTVLTIHNLLNQGKGAPELVSYAGLPASWFSLDGFEFYGEANCLKAGLIAADRTNTVSETYAREICESPLYGFGLEGVLRMLRDAGRLSGIVNGIDESRWRMESLVYDGSAEDAERAIALKEERQRRLYVRWNWPATDRPLLAFRGRWDRQKGVELLAEAMAQILELANVAIVTWGTPGEVPTLRRAWERLNEYAAQWPERLVINPVGIDAREQVPDHYQVADFFLMPSRYEPCGLIQMECQRYGTIPLVRATGGLVDTVSEQPDPAFPSPNGFAFSEMAPRDLVAAVQRAVAAYHDPAARRTLISHALQQKNGWDDRVAAYEALYRE